MEYSPERHSPRAVWPLTRVESRRTIRALELPRQIYLRHRDGESIGPLSVRVLEVLFDSRVVDESTPVSETGVMFKALRDWPGMLERVQDVKRRLGEGEDVWAEPLPADLPDAVVEAAAPQNTHDLETAHPLKGMLRAAVERSTGRLCLIGARGELQLLYKEGKVIALDTTIEERSLERHLVETRVVPAPRMAEAVKKAPEMGGDLGGALIALGIVPPHVYLEHFAAWAKKTLGAILTERFDTAVLEEMDVASPAVPLGFDRLGILIDIVRDGTDRSRLNELLLPKRPCPLIPSQVEGVKLEELKLKPGELRVMNAINGAKTLGDIIDTLGGSEQKALEILRVIYFATETGVAVLGPDPLVSKEIAEAARLKEQYQKLLRRHYFEILGVTEKSSDEETRTRYAELAKEHHPDKLRQGAAHALVDARREIFALISEAFDALETEAQRYAYANDLDQGRAGSTDDLLKAQGVLRSETLFKKSEILFRMRRYDEALAHLDEAIALKPDDTEFKIHRAYQGVRQAQKSGGDPEAPQKAIKTILALMKNDANIAAGYMFLGILNKEIGKAELAVKYFEKVLEYDERNQDALREVRLANMRSEKSRKKRLF